MSEKTKELVKRAKEYYQEVSEFSKQYQKGIPDKQLGEKLRKVSEQSQEVVKHIEQHQE